MFFHSFMGKNFTSAEDVKVGGAWWNEFGLGNTFYSYDLGYDEERGMPQFMFSDVNGTSMEETLASILFFARTLADESADGKKVKDLVVTISADASLRQRQAVVAAGEIAGCRVLTLVHENSAFAVQRAVDFQPEKNTTETILFYNVGSRKTEVTLVKFGSRQAGMVAGKTAPVTTVLGSAIDTRIGGHLFDLKIADVMLKKFQEKHPDLAEGIVKNARAMRKLLSTAQKTKAVLSANKNSPFIVESLYNDIDFQASIKREDFEEMCSEMFSKLTEPIDKALEAANLTIADITMVEVVGGAWRVPKVQQILSDYLEAAKGQKVHLGQHLNGEEGAAMGAALIGANSSSSFRVKKIFFTDISVHEYAVQVKSLTGEWEKNITTLYPKGSMLGGKKKLAFSLSEDFGVRLFENGVLMAEYAVTGLADQLKDKWADYNMTGTPKISVQVQLEGSGIIELRSPLVTVEEAFWANETRKIPKNVTNATNATTETDEKEDKSEEKADEEKADEEKDGDEKAKTEEESDNKTAANKTGNTTNKTDDFEVETYQKLKRKKHEKKLKITRTDFKPLPMTTEQIAEAKARMEALVKIEEDAAAVVGLKNELEAAIYGSRDKMESESIIKVSTEEQREEMSKLCMEAEEWMSEAATNDKTEFSQRLTKLQDLLGPMEERAIELENRADLPEAVEELVKDANGMKAHIAKNMSWVNENKTAEASTKLEEFEEWWVKKQEAQKQLPDHEAPSYTKQDVMEKVNKVHKDWLKLKNTKKPKEKKAPKAKANATANATDAGAAADTEPEKEKGEPLPADLEATEKELAALREKKATAVENEDFDLAHSLKTREKALKEHVEKLKADKTEL
jgi:hypoxia up-regulated 1